MKKTNKTNKTSKLAIFSGSLLVTAFAVLAFAPVIKSNAAEQSADVNVTVNPIISISLDKSTLSFDITPTVAGVFDSGSIVATVDTNSSGGYELYFSSEDSATAMTSLVTSSTITSDFTSAVTSSTMANNKWGYSLDATNFSKIPALANQVKIKNLNRFPASNERDTTVTIGTKIDSTLPSGTYSKRVVFSAIAHPEPNINKLVKLTSMQDPNLSQYCADTYTPTKNATELAWEQTFFGDLVPRASVKDSRDDKYYLISKLADGNCWMSQNLELMLDSTKALTNENTDLNTKTSWTPQNSTLTVMPTSSTWARGDGDSTAVAYSYYPIASDRYYQGGTVKSSTPTASGAEYDWEKTGVYYNWNAANAGSGTQYVDTATLNDSICPKGWKIPRTTGDNKSWTNLITTKYGMASNQQNAAALIRSPFNLIRNGYYHRWTQVMSDQGAAGYLWSPSSQNNYRAYHISYSSSSGFDLNTFGYKGGGMPIRCVAR